MPRPDQKPQSGWLSACFKAACFMAAGAAAHMAWQAVPPMRGGDSGKGPYDTVLAETARARTEVAAFAMRAQARAVCTAVDTDLAVLRGVKLVFDRGGQADNIDGLIAKADKDYPAYNGLHPIYKYTPHKDYSTGKDTYSGSAQDVQTAIAALDALRAAKVPVMGYMLEDGEADDHVAAVFERRADGAGYFALGYKRVVNDGNRYRDVQDSAMMDAQAFEMVMQKMNDGALNAPGRYVVYKNPFTVNGAGWRVEKIDGRTVERVKGHPDTALKVPEGICLK